MTASCSRTDEVGILKCTCPTFNGRFQVRQDIPEAMAASAPTWFGQPHTTPTQTVRPSPQKVLGSASLRQRASRFVSKLLNMPPHPRSHADRNKLGNESTSWKTSFSLLEAKPFPFFVENTVS